VWKASLAQGHGGSEIAEHPIPRVSLVSVTFNAAGFVGPFCAAVARLRHPGLEIIVVDNASRDGTATEVRRLLPQAMVIESDRNLGFAGGSNLGASRASGDVLFFLNPDALPPPGAVAQLCGPVACRPEIGAAGCKLVYPDGRLQSAGGMIGPNAHCAHRGHGDADHGQYDEGAIVDYVPGAALAIRRTLFAEVGGFYAGYFPGFYEDAELCVRLRERGYEVHYFPTPRIIHLEGASMSAASAYWMQRNRLLFLARVGQPRRRGALVREVRWLYGTYLGPLGRALLGGHPWRLHAEWRRVRPVLAGTVAAVLRVPGAVREARRSRSAATNHRDGASADSAGNVTDERGRARPR